MRISADRRLSPINTRFSAIYPYYRPEKIIKIKQNYFTKSWLPYRIVLNTALLQRIREYGKTNCYLWTSASKQRALSVLRRCKLKHFFNRILFDKKTNIAASIQKLKGRLHSDNFIIFDNDPALFENHHIQIMERIVSEKFHVYVYSVDKYTGVRARRVLVATQFYGYSRKESLGYKKSV